MSPTSSPTSSSSCRRSQHHHRAATMEDCATTQRRRSSSIVVVDNDDATTMSASACPMRNYDGTEMRDARSDVVYRSQFLSTHPLRTDCKERVGYGGKKFTYVSGDGVIRTMNAVFGHGGWSSQITMERNVLSEKDERGRWHVGYLASVRVSLLQSNGGPGASSSSSSHEDCGSGEGIDPNKVKAHEKALKSAITDAMKRAARHYGERLGNALYVKGNGARTAPRTNKDALDQLERRDALNLFGDQAVLRANNNRDGGGSGGGDVACKRSPSSSSAGTKVGTADSQKENWPQNRIDGPGAVGNSSRRRHPSPDACAVAAPSTAPLVGVSSVLPSPTASSSLRGTAQFHGGVRTANPSLVNETNNKTYQPPNSSTNNVIHQNPNNHNSHNIVRQPPNNSTNNNTYQPSNNNNNKHNTTHQIPNNNNNNNNNHHTLMMNAPQPPNLMAPPSRPVYNPGSVSSDGTAQYNGGGNRHVPPGGKRSLDRNGTAPNGSRGHGMTNGATGYANVNTSNNGGGDVSKRQKLNPYNSNGGKKRMSV